MREKRYSILDLIAIAIISGIVMSLIDHIDLNWVG